MEPLGEVSPLRYGCASRAEVYCEGVRVLGVSHYAGNGNPAWEAAVKDTAKGFAITAVVLVTVGAVLLSLGAISLRASQGESGADIGGDIAILAGLCMVGLGLLFGVAVAGLTAMAKHREVRFRADGAGRRSRKPEPQS